MLEYEKEEGAGDLAGPFIFIVCGFDCNKGEISKELFIPFGIK